MISLLDACRTALEAHGARAADARALTRLLADETRAVLDARVVDRAYLYERGAADLVAPDAARQAYAAFLQARIAGAGERPGEGPIARAHARLEAHARRPAVAADEAHLLVGRAYVCALRLMAEEAKATLKIATTTIELGHRGGREIDKLVQSLAGAVKRGVAVQLLLGGRQMAERPRAWRSGDKLMQRGVAVRRADTRRRGVHAKFAIADTGVLIVGSHNLSGASVYRYGEASVGLKSDALAREMTRYFDALWAEAAPEPGAAAC